MRQHLKTFLLALTLLFLPGVRQVCSQTELDRLVDQALSANPDLKSAQARWQAFQEQISISGAWPDPMFSVGMMNFPPSSFALDQMEMSGVELELSQRIPLFNQGLRQKSARQSAETERQNVVSLKNFLVSQVKQTYYDLWFYRKAQATAARNKSVLEDMVKVATAKYSVGEAGQAEVSKAQIELTFVMDRILELETESQKAQAGLNLLLNRPAGDTVQIGEELLPMEPNLSETGLQELARAVNPGLNSGKSEVQQLQFEQALARRGYYPDLEIGAAYLLRRNRASTSLGGENLLSLRLSIDLPLFFWNKQSKEVSRAGFGLESGRQKLQDLENKLNYSVSAKFYEFQKGWKKIQLYRQGLLVQARQSLESARAGYQVGSVSFLTLLDSHKLLLDFEIEYNRAISEYLKTLAQLEELVGQKLVN